MGLLGTPGRGHDSAQGRRLTQGEPGTLARDPCARSALSVSGMWLSGNPEGCPCGSGGEREGLCVPGGGTQPEARDLPVGGPVCLSLQRWLCLEGSWLGRNPWCLGLDYAGEGLLGPAPQGTQAEDQEGSGVCSFPIPLQPLAGGLPGQGAGEMHLMKGSWGLLGLSGSCQSNGAFASQPAGHSELTGVCVRSWAEGVYHQTPATPASTPAGSGEGLSPQQGSALGSGVPSKAFPVSPPQVHFIHTGPGTHGPFSRFSCEWLNGSPLLGFPVLVTCPPAMTGGGDKEPTGPVSKYIKADGASDKDAVMR